MEDELTIGAMSERTGVAPSALRFYEAEGLIHATRSDGGQRRYSRDTIRRLDRSDGLIPDCRARRLSRRQGVRAEGAMRLKQRAGRDAQDNDGATFHETSSTAEQT